MEKRKHENAFNAIGFTYKTPYNSPHEAQHDDVDGTPMGGIPYHNLQRLEHPSTATVDFGSEKDQFVPPAGLVLPNGMQLVSGAYGRLGLV